MKKYIRPTKQEEAEINRAIASDPDTYSLTTAEIAAGRRGRPRLSNPKESTTIRLDHDVVAHFKADGKGWQTRINEVLKREVEANTTRIHVGKNQAPAKSGTRGNEKKQSVA